MALPKTGLISLLLSLLLMTACASGPPAPTTLVSQAETSIRQAESAGADTHAPVALREAKKRLASAKSHIGNENYPLAQRQLEKAIAEANYAEARSMAEKSQRAANEVEENLEALQREINSR